MVVSSGLCPATDANANSTNYCIKSNLGTMAGLTGTYTQLIEGIPEWFYTGGDKIAILHWTELYDATYSSHIHMDG